MELAQPCHGAARANTPLFVNTFTSLSFTYSELETILGNMLKAVLPDGTADGGGSGATRFSWHSFRIYLCTALHESKCPDAVIQALLRWRSDKSMKEYKRLTYAAYDSWLQGAQQAEVRTVTAPNLLPLIDVEERHVGGVEGLQAPVPR
jgi:hypothetical protein